MQQKYVSDPNDVHQEFLMLFFIKLITLELNYEILINVFFFTLLSMSPIIPVSAEASLKLVLEVFLVALATGKLPPESWRDKPADPFWEN